jgi:hypothetical protein
MKEKTLVTVINDDYTVRAYHCEIQQELSESEDGPITHYGIFWYEDIWSGEDGCMHIVPAKNVLFQRGEFNYKRKIFNREPDVVPYRIGIPETLRNSVYDRDGRKCVKCGATEDLCLDHKHPFSKGGKTEESNLQTMCRTCNSKKRARIE